VTDIIFKRIGRSRLAASTTPPQTIYSLATVRMYDVMDYSVSCYIMPRARYDVSILCLMALGYYGLTGLT
jgi:hypothetical protein